MGPFRSYRSANHLVDLESNALDLARHLAQSRRPSAPDLAILLALIPLIASGLALVLQTLFGQVAARIVLQYANTSRQVTLAYPVALIGDAVPPQISNVQAQNVPDGVKITWTTNEFATSEVRYGTTSGTYTQTVSDPLFERTHSLTLTGLTAGRMYYFVVRGADRSGNQAQSGQHQIRAQMTLFVPLIQRR